MKFLTLNTHSWMEENPQQKFEDLLKDILEKQYDLICFQEINQTIESPVAVSYTHLDVYKRQPQDSCQAFGP